MEAIAMKSGRLAVAFAVMAFGAAAVANGWIGARAG